MKKLLNGILTIFITIFICLFCISFCIKDIIVNTVSKEIVGKELTSMISDFSQNFTESVDDKTLKEIENYVTNNESIASITGKLFDGIINSVISDNETEVPDIKEDIINLINENEAILKKYNIEFTDAEKEKMIDAALNSGVIEEAYNESIKSFKKEMPDEVVAGLKVFDRVTSSTFRWIVLSIILILTLLIALIKKSWYRWTFNLGFAFALSGISFAIITPFIASSITNIIGEGAPSINVSSLVNMGYGCFAICALCIIIYVVGNIITKRKNKEYNY